MPGWTNALGVLVLANTPRSVFSPIPAFALSIFFLYRPFSVASLSLATCISGVAFSVLSVWGANLWNHVNDLEEDRLSGRDTVLTRGELAPHVAAAVALVFYAASVATCTFGPVVSRNLALPMAITFCLVTFLYSWRRLRPLHGMRLKEHWAGEIAVYAIAIPAHTMALATIYAPADARSLAITVPIFAYLFAGLLLKDLKDISFDDAAGHRTLGVVFPAVGLLRGACILLLAFYAGAAALSAFGVVGRGGLIVNACAAAFLFGVAIPLRRRGWGLSTEDSSRINLLVKSTYIALPVWGIGSVFS